MVIGLVETYGRAETEAQLAGLEVIPRRRLPHKNVELEEMDLDAILARKPQLCVVDELAHTNAPGSRHEKRYQDVLELLDAGISVMTAVNIQHLETLNDLVSRVTGVRVRETVPDTFLDRADEVINVDVTVDELRTRLRQGKVYKPEKIEQALSNFFREGNLSTLRELALRAVADEVGEKAASYRQREGLEPALIPERVMVCMSSSASAPRVIRAGARIAVTPGRAVVRGLRRHAARSRPARIKPADREQLGAQHRARREPRRHRRARDRGSSGRRADRLRPARRHHPRHLRPELADAGGDPDEGIDAQPVPRRSEGRRRPGGAACERHGARPSYRASLRHGSRWPRIAARSASCIVAVIVTAGCRDVNVNAALAQLSQARHLAGDLLTEFTRAADAANRAVMAESDALSVTFAHEAEPAKQAVRKDIDALRPLLQDARYANEARLLQEFVTRFTEYEALDRRVLDLAVENTNLQAQRLSFGPAQAAADEFRDAVEAVAPSAPAKDGWHVKALAATAVAAVREIQVAAGAAHRRRRGFGDGRAGAAHGGGGGGGPQRRSPRCRRWSTPHRGPAGLAPPPRWIGSWGSTRRSSRCRAATPTCDLSTKLTPF